MRKSTVIVVAGIIGLIGVGLFVYYVTMRTTVPTPRTSASGASDLPDQEEPTSPPAQVLGKPDFTLTAQEYFDELADAFAKDLKAGEGKVDGKAHGHNGEAVRTKFVGKVVEISGVVQWVGLDNFAHPYIGLKIQPRPGMIDRVLECQTFDKVPWAHVSDGQTVRLRGQASGILSLALYGHFYNCIIVEAGPNPAVVATANDLCAALAADAKAATDKFDDKQAIVTGEVIEISKSKPAPGVQGFVAVPMVLLKGAGNAKVTCYFHLYQAKRVEKLHRGEQIKLYGTLHVGLDREIVISRCLLIPPPATPHQRD
jgi:hypothetical protein